jgi:hypothetical protein
VVRRASKERGPNGCVNTHPALTTNTPCVREGTSMAESQSTDFVHRFLNKVARNPVTGCWEWQSNINPGGYGTFWLNQRPFRAHRLSYQIFRDTPGDLMVCHRCDNRRCVNPAHLFLGTAADNAADAQRKGRCASGRGAGRPVSKLPHYAVAEIRRLRSKGASIRDIAQRFGISKSYAGRVASGQRR